MIPYFEKTLYSKQNVLYLFFMMLLPKLFNVDIYRVFLILLLLLLLLLLIFVALAIF